MQTMGGDPQDFPYDQWGGMPRTEQEIDRLRQQIVDRAVLETLCIEVLNEDSVLTGTSEFVQFVRDNRITKVQDIMTLTRQEFKDYYDYDISVVHYRRIQAFSHWYSNAGDENEIDEFPRVMALTSEVFDEYMITEWRPPVRPSGELGDTAGRVTFRQQQGQATAAEPQAVAGISSA